MQAEVESNDRHPRPARWWRRPTLHFALLGAALFGAYALQDATPAPAAPAGRPTVTIPAGKVAALRAEFAAAVGRQPDRDEEQALLAKAIDEELLYREALALGLDRGDRSVEWRLAEKMRFLDGEEGCGGEAGDTAALAAQARAIGLEHDDPVLRRQMIHKLRLLPRAAADADAADPAALAAYYTLHRQRYRQPARVSLTHVFLGRTDEAAARTLLERLRADPRLAATLGEPLAAGPVLTASSREQVRKRFGDAFADAVFALPTGEWLGPIASPFGAHLVLVRERQPPRDPELAEVESQVRRQMAAERRAEHLATLLRELRAAYDVRIETPG